ncbi:helix-turn-helix transcriptional regulator [Affinibrenneria salicis]|uniref:Helix-turn-helix transcriptional regulator n=2 Tax=Affinibrenneria salicis TaxID=2590031 RepID=A0A5J5FVX0_9GAMM|nr:helix-turn-helix transcriptional regulator [Affinibrenneria salicis]
MPEIPIPFITAFLLLVLFLRIRLMRGKGRPAKTETAFIAISCLSIILCGLNWGTTFSIPTFFQPIVAATVPPLFWLYAASGKANEKRRAWRHLLPPLCVAVLLATENPGRWPLVDLSLMMIFAGYGIALIHAALDRSTDCGDARRLWQKAPFWAGVYFVVSAIIDIIIALELDVGNGQRVPEIIGVAHIATLLVLTFFIVTKKSAPAENKPSNKTQPASDGDLELADKLEQFIRINRLYTDPNMTLQRLARRMGIPARHISETINRVYGRNISQVMNSYRLDEVKRLLSQTDSRITDIMLDCGFQTKSNFNREFLKATGMTPSQWRRANAAPSSAIADATPASENR